jgi:hypothetical protein
VLGTLETLSSKRYVPPYAMALVHAGLDERVAIREERICGVFTESGGQRADVR